ncbi:hypothetical protein Hypma_011291 [Hypsizygus marmoreus]|uniref:Uncharacterized protein n=1 Tax=Hypsizygus marmoreus TaxID=39966 RepID=A0A369JQR3_HYPMA|nr:hypothetical protein Hypma_011291 [Hypsizygus marmoreus]
MLLLCVSATRPHELNVVSVGSEGTVKETFMGGPKEFRNASRRDKDSLPKVEATLCRKHADCVHR